MGGRHSNDGRIDEMNHTIHALYNINANIKKQLEETKKATENLQKKAEEEKKELEDRQNKAREEFEQKSKETNELYLKNINTTLKEDINKFFEKRKEAFPSKELEEQMILLKGYEEMQNKIENSIKQSVDTIKDLQYTTKMNHFNILVLGQTGVGKSTLINSVLKLPPEEEAETGTGKPITQETKEYTSKSVKGIRLWDSRGIELKDYGIEAVEQYTNTLIQKQIELKDPDKFIHCIWYCVTGERIQESEKDLLINLMNTYKDSVLPIIVVYTKASDDEKTAIMTQVINGMFNGERKAEIVPVVAKEIVIRIREKTKNDDSDDETQNEDIKYREERIPVSGIKKLLKRSFEKAENAVQSACFDAVKQLIIATNKEKFINQVKELQSLTKVELNMYLAKLDENTDLKSKIQLITEIIQKKISILINENEQKLNQKTIEMLDNFFDTIITQWYSTNITMFNDEYLERRIIELKNKNNNVQTPKIVDCRFIELIMLGILINV